MQPAKSNPITNFNANNSYKVTKHPTASPSYPSYSPTNSPILTEEDYPTNLEIEAYKDFSGHYWWSGKYLNDKRLYFRKSDYDTLWLVWLNSRSMWKIYY